MEGSAMKAERQWHNIFCHICPVHCARKIAVEGGKIVEVERDTESGYPNAWCTFTKARIMKEVCGHPDRLRYPQKRVGPKGSGKWERISWDEALDTIAQKLLDYRKNFGPESVALCLGEPKGMEFAFAQRFASAFGTPNCATPGNY
jgi:anaerobic selenocysteine-containing dehydrogenase